MRDAKADVVVSVENGRYRLEVSKGGTAMLVVYCRHVDGTVTIEDLRPARCVFPSWAKGAVFDGWARAVQRVFEGDRAKWCLPSELMPPEDVLGLKTLVTAEDYERAFLAKKRLGRFLS